jgi:hypothetical protein
MGADEMGCVDAGKNRANLGDDNRHLPTCLVENESISDQPAVTGAGSSMEASRRNFAASSGGVGLM